MSLYLQTGRWRTTRRTFTDTDVPQINMCIPNSNDCFSSIMSVTFFCPEIYLMVLLKNSKLDLLCCCTQCKLCMCSYTEGICACVCVQKRERKQRWRNQVCYLVDVRHFEVLCSVSQHHFISQSTAVYCISTLAHISNFQILKHSFAAGFSRRFVKWSLVMKQLRLQQEGHFFLQRARA